ncbi:Serine/arginine-rich splicing factor SR45a-like protein [Drosera capensis]
MATVTKPTKWPISQIQPPKQAHSFAHNKFALNPTHSKTKKSNRIELPNFFYRISIYNAILAFANLLVNSRDQGREKVIEFEHENCLLDPNFAIFEVLTIIGGISGIAGTWFRMSYSRRSHSSPSPFPYMARNNSVSRSKSRRSRESSAENPGNNLYVAGLSARVTKGDLEEHFSSEGKVVDVHLVTDPWSKETRGFGFVTMSNLDEVERCLKYLDRSVLLGRVITVEKAKRSRGRTPTPGRYLGLVAASRRRCSPRSSSHSFSSEHGRKVPVLHTIVGVGPFRAPTPIQYTAGLLSGDTSAMIPQLIDTMEAAGIALYLGAIPQEEGAIHLLSSTQEQVEELLTQLFSYAEKKQYQESLSRIKEGWLISREGEVILQGQPLFEELFKRESSFQPEVTFSVEVNGPIPDDNAEDTGEECYWPNSEDVLICVLSLVIEAFWARMSSRKQECT